MDKPVIGISLALRVEDHDMQPLPSYRFEYLKQHYYEALEDHGALPIALPATELEQNAMEYSRRITGLLLVGGEDLNPSMYGEKVDRLTERYMPRRDQFESWLILACIEQQKPILGICRGAQILNVVCGGSLFQDLSYKPGAHNHSQIGERDFSTKHRVTIIPHTLLHTLIGREQIETNTSHHQAIKKVGTGLKVSAEADDGVIEAIEGPGFTLGVQWHPESWAADEISRSIFSGFVVACSKKSRTSE